MQDEQYRGHGTTDGTFRHARYFLCEEKCGLFVALDKLSMNPEGNTLEKAPRGGQSNSYAVSRGSTTSGRSYPQDNGPPADNLRPRSQAIQQPNVRDDQRPRFKKGDRVVAFDRKGNCIHGTVCWAGSSEKIRNIVAIETVSSVICSLILCSTEAFASCLNTRVGTWEGGYASEIELIFSDVKTVFPRIDAAVFICSICYFCEATIRGYSLLEGGIYYLGQY